MEQFYLQTIKGQQGPFSFDELKCQELTEETLVRIEGSSLWLPANRFEPTNVLVKPRLAISAANSSPFWGEFSKGDRIKDGYRKYSSILWGIPLGQSWEDTCAITPAKVRGHSFQHPSRCINAYCHLWGEFDVPDTSLSNPPSLGVFTGRVVAEWLDDGRKMKLKEDFSFTDPHGIIWKAPAGWVVDGASIPKELWSAIGGPFEGKYRNASVIHDVACDNKNRPWTDVHWVFHEAMLASGVDPIQAQIMFAGVWAGGPKW